jgi:hypothetical protein
VRHVARRTLVAALAGVALLAVAAGAFWDTTREARTVDVQVSVEPLSPCMPEAAHGSVMAVVAGDREPTAMRRGVVGRPFRLRLHARGYLFFFASSTGYGAAPPRYGGVPLSVRGSSDVYSATVTSSRLVLVASQGCVLIPGVPD